MLTPFDLKLEHALTAERERFANTWLFRRHNIERGSLDVEDFRGGRIRLGGSCFEGPPQIVFWAAVKRYLLREVQNRFDDWDTATRDYVSNREETLDITNMQLLDFCRAIITKAVATDRRLRGRGDPRSVRPYDASTIYMQSSERIAAFAKAHKLMMANGEANSLLEKRPEPPPLSEPAVAPIDDLFIAIDNTRQLILISDGAKLHGHAIYPIMKFLIDASEKDRADHLLPNNHRCFPAKAIAGSMARDEGGAVRQAIKNARKELKKASNARNATKFDPNAIIELVRSKGYRLNTAVRAVTLAEFESR